MSRQRFVSLELIRGSEQEYLIKDKLGITIGRIFILELDKENKYCLFRIKFYKDSTEGYSQLKETLELMLHTLFRKMDVYKVDVLTHEQINLAPFTELGFELEGIVYGRLEHEGERFSELLFGISEFVFNGNHIEKGLRIKGKNIELKVLTPEDAEQVLDYYKRNREYLKPFEPTREEEFYRLENQAQVLRESYKQFLNGSSIPFGIYKDNRFIGKVQISNIVMGVFKNAFVGYSIDEKEQGNGYMKEALQLAVRYALEELDLHRIEASTLVDNRRSQSVLKSCGFEELGISKSYLYINGQWRDHIVFYKVKQK